MLNDSIRFQWLASAALALVGCATTTQDAASAQQALTTSSEAGAADEPRHPPHAPPLEAFDACNGKALGDACSVTLKDRTLAGQCAAPPPGSSETRLACRPDGPPPGPPPGDRADHGDRPPPPPGPPPAEAFTACDGKTEGAACSVTIDGKSIAGVCKGPPPGVSDTRLACAPPPPPAR